MDILFLEVDVYPQAFQLTDGFQHRHCIPGKPADGLDQHHIDLSSPAVLQQALKLRTAGPGAGETFIGVHPGILPVLPALNEAAVVADLRG